MIVSNVDRLTRASKLDEAVIFERLSRAGARFVAANEGIDTDSPGADLTLDIMAAIARQQWRRYKSNWDDAKRNAVERGVHIGRVPFGYLREDDGRLAPHPRSGRGRARGVRHARGGRVVERDLHAVGGDRSDARCQRGWGTSDSGARWIMASVRRMLRNEVYLGVAYHAAPPQPGRARAARHPGRVCSSADQVPGTGRARRRGHEARWPRPLCGMRAQDGPFSH